MSGIAKNSDITEKTEATAIDKPKRARKLRRRLLIAFEVLLILVFIPPLFRNAIHIGVVFGLSMTVLLFLVTLNYRRIKPLIIRLISKKAGKAVFVSFCTVFGLLVAYALVLSGLMLASTMNAPKTPDAVIVLGCKVSRNGAPSLMLAGRIKAAYEYLDADKDVICVVSGGKGADEPYSEAEVMKSRLVSMGIDENRIIAEDRSESTRENIEFTLSILEEKGIDVKELAIVTDGFHQFRASLVAREFDLSPTAVNAYTPPWLIAAYWLREWFALSHRFVFGS